MVLARGIRRATGGSGGSACVRASACSAWEAPAEVTERVRLGEVDIVALSGLNFGRVGSGNGVPEGAREPE